MPNIKSAKKRVKVNKAKNLQNKSYRSALRSTLKAADVALEENSDNKAELVENAIKKIDMAATKGILHKNCAARKKSSLARRLNATA